MLQGTASDRSKSMSFTARAVRPRWRSASRGDLQVLATRTSSNLALQLCRMCSQTLEQFVTFTSEHNFSLTMSQFCSGLNTYLFAGLAYGRALVAAYWAVIIRVLKCSMPIYVYTCLLYTSPSPRDGLLSRMPSSA